MGSTLEATEEDKMTKDNQIRTLKEEKCNHLNKVKGKLEQALDECEDGLEREKKAKGDVEKLQRKDKEIASVSSKIDDEATLGAKYAKQVKELQGRLEELDEELTIERANRAKAEKNRATLSRDIGDLAEKLEDAGNNTATQIELNK